MDLRHVTIITTVLPLSENHHSHANITLWTLSAGIPPPPHTHTHARATDSDELSSARTASPSSLHGERLTPLVGACSLFGGEWWFPRTRRWAPRWQPRTGWGRPHGDRSPAPTAAPPPTPPAEPACPDPPPLPPSDLSPGFVGQYRWAQRFMLARGRIGQSSKPEVARKLHTGCILKCPRTKWSEVEVARVQSGHSQESKWPGVRSGQRYCDWLRSLA